MPLDDDTAAGRLHPTRIVVDQRARGAHTAPCDSPRAWMQCAPLPTPKVDANPLHRGPRLPLLAGLRPSVRRRTGAHVRCSVNATARVLARRVPHGSSAEHPRNMPAFLHTETETTTSPTLSSTEVLDRALEALHEYIARKTEQRQHLESVVLGLADLNHRQRALLGHALRHPNYRYTIEGHRMWHGVVYQTARADLLELTDQKLLDARKAKNRWHVHRPSRSGAAPVRDGGAMTDRRAPGNALSHPAIRVP